jgi:prephenate dehydrogenase
MGFERLSILGVGLLGGSIGLAVKTRLSGCHVVGYGHRPQTLRKALELGAIDEAQTSAAAAVRGADLVILCTPVGLFDGLLKEIAPALKAGAIVTDVGSTKRSVVKAAEAILPSSVKFVGSHPMAGSEKRGVEFASAGLFQNAVCVITPTSKTDPKAADSVRGFWSTLGMRLIDMNPDDHDLRLAQASHLPHAVAAALVAIQHEAGLAVAGKGFLDATRIAGGDGGLWRDILLDNRDNMLAAIQSLQGQLGTLTDLLQSGNGQALAQWLDDAAKRRNQMGK